MVATPWADPSATVGVDALRLSGATICPRFQALQREMTGDQLADALATIGWSQHECARRLRIQYRVVRRMIAGTEEIPPEMERWIRVHEQAIRALPPLPDGWRSR